MIVFPVLIPGQNFLSPGTEGKSQMPREGKGNLRLVFPGITGNGNSRSPLVGPLNLESYVKFSTLYQKNFGLNRTQIIKTPLHYNTQVTGLATCGVVEWMCCSTIKKSESRSVVEWSVMQPGSSVALVALSQYHVGRTAGTK